VKAKGSLRRFIADDQQVGAFCFGLTIGVLVGYRLVVPPRSQEVRPRLPEPAPEVLPPAPAAPPMVWRERTDTFRPTVGQIEVPSGEVWYRDNVRVAFEGNVWHQMERHAGRDTRREQLGLLLGRVIRVEPGGGLLTVVTQAVAVPSSDASPTHVSVTHESTEPIAAAIRKLPPGATVVGWFHSHPGLGVFLSGTDLRTQRSCFSQEWHVAVVLDPVRGERGVFVGPHGKPARRSSRQIQGGRAI